MTLKKSLGVASLFLFVFSAKADFNQFVPKQEGMKKLDSVEKPKDKGLAHGIETGPDYLKDVKIDPNNTGHVPGKKAPDIDFSQVPSGDGAQGMGTMETQKGYIEFEKEELLRENHRKGESTFTFAVLKDDFDYDDGRGTFEKIFEGPGDITKGAYLLLGLESYLMRNYIDLYWKGSLGVGLSYGQGQFVNGEKADANFRLWKIPADLGLGLSIPLGSWFSVSATGGGSLLLLMQNRSDVNKRNEKRNRRQFSPGYFTEFKFKWNLGKVFEDTSFTMLREYDVSNIYLDFTLRQHEYNSFKEENLSISGQSMGLGFSFEFL